MHDNSPVNLDDERINYGQYQLSFSVFSEAAPMAARREQHKMEKTLLSVRRAVLHIRAPTTAKLKLRGHRVAETEHAACRIDAHKLHAKCQSSLDTQTRQNNFWQNRCGDTTLTITKLMFTVANGQLCFRSAQASFDEMTCSI